MRKKNYDNKKAQLCKLRNKHRSRVSCRAVWNTTITCVHIQQALLGRGQHQVSIYIDTITSSPRALLGGGVPLYFYSPLFIFLAQYHGSSIPRTARRSHSQDSKRGKDVDPLQSSTSSCHRLSFSLPPSPFVIFLRKYPDSPTLRTTGRSHSQKPGKKAISNGRSSCPHR